MRKIWLMLLLFLQATLIAYGVDVSKAVGSIPVWRLTAENNLGSVTHIVSPAGTKVAEASYDASARIYDPLTGRFLGYDPVVQDPFNSQNFNKYSYCLNNPFRYTDPDGKFVFSLFLGPVGAILDAACWGAVIGGSSYAMGVANGRRVINT